MRHPQQIDTNKYLAAFAITTLVFIAGIFIGGRISTSKLESINIATQSMRADVLGAELQYQLVLESACNITDPVLLTDELYKIGSKLDFMENDLGKKNPEVLGLKEYYSMLEVEHWLLLKKVRKQCNTPYDLVLYFYSNLEDCPDCEEQGHVLNYIHKKIPAVNIYSFDINIDNPVLSTIKTLYRIKQAPSLVIDEKVHVGFMDSEAIENGLNVTVP